MEGSMSISIKPFKFALRVDKTDPDWIREKGTVGEQIGLTKKEFIQYARDIKVLKDYEELE
jgi:hypothetical protein